MSAGPSLEIPCTRCGTPNEVDPERLAGTAGEVRCTSCGEVLVVLGGAAGEAEAGRREAEPPDPPQPHAAIREPAGPVADARPAAAEPLPDPADLLQDSPDAPAMEPARSGLEGLLPAVDQVDSHAEPDEIVEVIPGEASALTDARHVECPACGHRFVEDDGGARASVLIVEDTDFFLVAATDALGERYRTIGVKTAADALDVLRRERVDLIVLDLALPDGAGVQVLQESRHATLPVLIYTSASEDVMLGEAWHRLQELGADDLLFKGVNSTEALVEKVGRLLEEKSA